MTDEKLLNYFATNALSPEHSVIRLFENYDHTLRGNLLSELEKVETSGQVYKKLIHKFKSWPKVYSPDLRARVWIYQELVTKEIAARRLEILIEDYNKSRPRPFDHDAMLDVSIDCDGMIPMSCFVDKHLYLTRNNYNFTLLTPLPARQSNFWIEKKLNYGGFRDSCFIRPDPFLFGREDEFTPAQYRMWVYGLPLDWDRIKNLRETETGRWMNDDLNSDSFQFTEFVWRPTEKEIHFTLEEVPKLESLRFRGSRYFHSIYNRKDDIITHLDGAIRIYNEEELKTRSTIKLKDPDAVKIGKRIKLFKIDNEVEKDAWSNLIASYFVWNEDVASYFQKK